MLEKFSLLYFKPSKDYLVLSWRVALLESFSYSVKGTFFWPLDLNANYNLVQVYIILNWKWLINQKFSAILLFAAGIYQFSPLKQRCLERCQSPLAVLSQYFQEGTKGAIRLGLIHGQFCLGCCALLMSLLFVTGVMNLQAILLLTVLVIIEKLLSNIPYISQLIGCILLVLSLIVMI